MIKRRTYFAYLLFILIIMLCGCNNKKDIRNMSLKNILNTSYNGVKKDIPDTYTIIVNNDNFKTYLGDANIKYKEAIASEPKMTSVAHLVVIVRLDDNENVQNAKKEIEENINPGRWICVEAEKTIVEVNDNVIMLVMSNEENAEKIIQNFKNI